MTYSAHSVQDLPSLHSTAWSLHRSTAFKTDTPRCTLGSGSRRILPFCIALNFSTDTGKTDTEMGLWKISFFFLFSQKEELNLQWKEQNNLIQYYRAACKQLPPHVIIDGDRDEYLHWKSAARKVNFKIAWPFSSSFKNLSFLLNYKDYVACLIDFKLHILKCNLTVT